MYCYYEVMSKLIILRGNSGSGKSTVAKTIAKAAGHQLAVVDADAYRVGMFHPLGECGEDVAELMAHNVRFCLERGYDVFWDSIFYAHDRNRKYLEDFIRQHHPADNFIFNFDVSWEETVRRHQTRHKRHDFDAETMREWYKPVESLGYDFEYTVPEKNSIEDTVDYIRRIADM